MPQLPSAESFATATLDNFRAAFEHDAALRALFNSLWLGFASGLVATSWGH